MTSHPVFALRLSAGSASPGLAEDPVDEQDGHVAANPVTLARDAQKGADGGFPQAGVKGIELGHVRPGGVVGVPAAGKDTPAGLEELPRSPDQVRGISLDDELGVLADPVVVQGHVIWNEIQDQAEPASGKGRAGPVEALGTAEPLVNAVIPDAVRGTGDVVRGKVGKRVTVFLEQRCKCPVRVSCRPGFAARPP